MSSDPVSRGNRGTERLQSSRQYQQRQVAPSREVARCCNLCLIMLRNLREVVEHCSHEHVVIGLVSPAGGLFSELVGDEKETC